MVSEQCTEFLQREHPMESALGHETEQSQHSEALDVPLLSLQLDDKTRL